MNNPRKSPIGASELSYGEHAIKLGPKKLGESLDKCLGEVRLILSLPPGQSQGIARILHSNLLKIMGAYSDEE